MDQHLVICFCVHTWEEFVLADDGGHSTASNASEARYLFEPRDALGQSNNFEPFDEVEPVDGFGRRAGGLE